MSVLVYAENWEGTFRKSTYEAVSYASEITKLLNTNLIAISLGEVEDNELNKLGDYGVERILAYPEVTKSDSQSVSNIINGISEGIDVFIFSNTYSSKMIAPRLSAKIKAGLVTNVITLPSNISPITITRKAFSSKAIELIKIDTEKTILCVNPNCFELIENKKTPEIENPDYSNTSKITIKNTKKSSGKISLSEAEVIVSGGRGLKGPENWGLIEELAETLQAATACSKPVSDIGWRPHSEHVGQTGKVVSPNLYIAIGISGAIQHLAGVNSSKIMVAINSDPEAPFFKAAHYGIVGDAFEVVPKLINEIKKLER